VGLDAEERWAADFAPASMFSFPCMPRWLETHMKVILTRVEVRVERRVIDEKVGRRCIRDG